MAKDAYYKDGYQVAEGGDYKVSSKDNYLHSNTHTLTRVSDGAVIGVYSMRSAACKRAQQLGGNTHRSRRALSGTAHRPLTKKEQTHVERMRMTVKNTASHDKEVVPESEVISRSGRETVWTRTLVMKYLRQYSLGAGRTKYSIAKNRYTRKALKEAWSHIPASIRWDRESYLAGYDLPGDNYVDPETHAAQPEAGQVRSEAKVVRITSGNVAKVTPKQRLEADAAAHELIREYKSDLMTPEGKAIVDSILGPNWLDIEATRLLKPDQRIIEWRRAYAAGTLAAWQIKRIEKIPGWSWDPKPKRATVLKFPDPKKRGESSFTPEESVSWLREQKKAGSLADEQIAEVERSIPGWEWTV